MQQDEILKEVRAIREAYAAEFNFDIHAIFADIMRRQRESGRQYVTLPPRRIRGKKEPATSGSDSADS